MTRSRLLYGGRLRLVDPMNVGEAPRRPLRLVEPGSFYAYCQRCASILAAGFGAIGDICGYHGCAGTILTDQRPPTGTAAGA